MTCFSVTIRPRAWMRTVFVLLLLIGTNAAVWWWILGAVVWACSPKVKIWFEAQGRVTWRRD